jgi:hypothetical protein
MLQVNPIVAYLLSFAFWLQPISPFGCLALTMVRSWIQVYTLFLGSLLARTAIRLGVLKAFTPALRIDGIATVGDVVFYTTLCVLSSGIYRGGICTLKVTQLSRFCSSQYTRLVSLRLIL